MPSETALRLRNQLDDAEVILKLERRGRDPAPGRPDSVIWLRPSDLPVGRLIPLLVELEGAEDSDASYHASKEDVREFAKRHDPSKRPDRDGFDYHIRCPTLDREFANDVNSGTLYPEPRIKPAPVTVSVKYELFSIPSATVTGERSTTDAGLHKGLRDIFWKPIRKRTTPAGFSSEANVKEYDRGRTEIVWWEVDWRLPEAVSGTVSVPFVVTVDSDIQPSLRRHLSNISIPMMAVIDGSPSARKETEMHETGVRVPHISLDSRRPEKTTKEEAKSGG